jgi:hypothetical protein
VQAVPSSAGVHIPVPLHALHSPHDDSFGTQTPSSHARQPQHSSGDEQASAAVWHVTSVVSVFVVASVEPVSVESLDVPPVGAGSVVEAGIAASPASTPS